jgi:hypothetical protein
MRRNIYLVLGVIIDKIQRKGIYKPVHIVDAFTTLVWQQGWKTDDLINMINGKFDKWKAYIEQLKNNNIKSKEQDALV